MLRIVRIHLNVDNNKIYLNVDNNKIWHEKCDYCNYLS